MNFSLNMTLIMLFSAFTSVAIGFIITLITTILEKLLNIQEFTGTFWKVLGGIKIASLVLAAIFLGAGIISFLIFGLNFFLIKI